MFQDFQCSRHWWFPFCEPIRVLRRTESEKLAKKQHGQPACTCRAVQFGCPVLKRREGRAKEAGFLSLEVQIGPEAEIERCVLAGAPALLISFASIPGLFECGPEAHILRGVCAPCLFPLAAAARFLLRGA